MTEIMGTIHKISITDFFQRCKKCGKSFYFSRNCERKTVICPHCGTKH